MALDGPGQMISGLRQFRFGMREKVEAPIQPVGEPLFQIRITEQGQQGWRQADGELRSAGWGSCGLLKNLQQRQLALHQGLEKPVFFQRARHHRAHIRQVGVKNEGDGAVAQVTNCPREAANLSGFGRDA